MTNFSFPQEDFDLDVISLRLFIWLILWLISLIKVF